MFHGWIKLPLTWFPYLFPSPSLPILFSFTSLFPFSSFHPRLPFPFLSYLFPSLPLVLFPLLLPFSFSPLEILLLQLDSIYWLTAWCPPRRGKATLYTPEKFNKRNYLKRARVRERECETDREREKSRSYLSSTNVDSKGLGGPGHLGLGVQHGNGSHCGSCKYTKVKYLYMRTFSTYVWVTYDITYLNIHKYPLNIIYSTNS